MVLLPIAFGIAVVALLAMLRRERHERESGRPAPRPPLVKTTLAVFAVLAALYIAVYVISTVTADPSRCMTVSSPSVLQHTRKRARPVGLASVNDQ